MIEVTAFDKILKKRVKSKSKAFDVLDVRDVGSGKVRFSGERDIRMHGIC